MGTPSNRRSPAYGEGRDALLRAAIKVTARGGLRALTCRAVAEEAGVVHGLVRFHFGSRDALIMAATSYSLAESIGVGQLASDATDPTGFGSGVEGIAGDNADLMAFQYEVILESRRRPALRGVVQELYDALWSTTEADLHQRGVTADSDLGVLVFAALDGLVFQELAVPDPDRAHRAAAALRDLLELARNRPDDLRRSSREDQPSAAHETPPTPAQVEAGTPTLVQPRSPGQVVGLGQPTGSTSSAKINSRTESVSTDYRSASTARACTLSVSSR
ncbi:MAG TPA: TetR/AcrR family transcriptional regulator [Marmoricola sp.]|nr:TetR/AcrR family transcriptional regulator [Marmoricola sp.]